MNARSDSGHNPSPQPDEVEKFDLMFHDPVIEAYKKDVDVTLPDRTLRLSIAERAQQLANITKFVQRFRPLVEQAELQLILQRRKTGSGQS